MDTGMDAKSDKVLSYKVLDVKGKEVGSIDLNPEVFGARIRPHLVQETVRWQLARRRSGTHQALTRTMKSGGAKKPYKQKGTGRARAGSSISPLWVGGASIHGPLPRDYDYRLPKRTRRQALISVLSEKVAKQSLLVLEELKISSGKTRDMAQVLEKLSIAGKKIVVIAEALDAKTVKATQNLPGITVLPVAGLNVYDLMRHPILVGSRAAISAVEKRVITE